MIHELKILESFADAIANGDKTFEVRENDRGFQKGDLIKFNVIDKYGISLLHHSILNKYFQITYVLNGWGIKEGYVVFGIKEMTVLPEVVKITIPPGAETSLQKILNEDKNETKL